MKQATAPDARKATVLPKRLWILLAVVAVLGFALYPRAPGTAFLPRMAEQPVILPDGKPLFVQKYEVSIAEWNACHADGGCPFALQQRSGKPDQDMPATGLSYPDVTSYLTWLNKVTGQAFRLPSLEEWEFMAQEVLPHAPDPIFTDPELSWASAYLMEPQTKRTLRPRGTFDTTEEGIVDLNGSVWEWTQDCYAGASGEVIAADRCPAFFVGGEHVAAISYLIRDPARGGCAVGSPPAHLGLRLVSDRKV